MGIYFKDVFIKIVFDDEIINEDSFKGPIAGLRIAVRIRDFREGRAGQNTKHKDSPSIKVINYGSGRGTTHSLTGDPIYFYLKNNKVEISYDRDKFDSKEIKYLFNFINHNYLNLSNYWFAPDRISDPITLKKYQDKIKDRILYNISNYDYRGGYDLDAEVTL